MKVPNANARKAHRACASVGWGRAPGHFVSTTVCTVCCAHYGAGRGVEGNATYGMREKGAWVAHLQAYAGIFALYAAVVVVLQDMTQIRRGE